MNILLIVPFAFGILLGAAIHVFYGMCDSASDRVLVTLMWAGFYMVMVSIFTAVTGWLFLALCAAGTAVSMGTVYLTRNRGGACW